MKQNKQPHLEDLRKWFGKGKGIAITQAVIASVSVVMHPRDPHTPHVYPKKKQRNLVKMVVLRSFVEKEPHKRKQAIRKRAKAKKEKPRLQNHRLMSRQVFRIRILRKKASKIRPT